MFGFGRKSKEKRSKEVRSESEEVAAPLPEAKADPAAVAVVARSVAVPESPYITPYPFTECPPKILTAYASSVYTANEGRLLTIELTKVCENSPLMILSVTIAVPLLVFSPILLARATGAFVLHLQLALFCIQIDGRVVQREFIRVSVL